MKALGTADETSTKMRLALWDASEIKQAGCGIHQKRRKKKERQGKGGELQKDIADSCPFITVPSHLFCLLEQVIKEATESDMKQ